VRCSSETTVLATGDATPETLLERNYYVNLFARHYTRRLPHGRD